MKGSVLTNEIVYPTFPKTEIGRKARVWFDLLWEKVVSFRKYENLPDSINRDYLETILMAEGNITWIKDKDGKLRSLRGASYGLDCYNFPTSVEISNPVLGTLKGEYGINAIWMRNNMYACPATFIVFDTAMALAQLDVDFKVNLDNLKLAKIFAVSNEEQARQVAKLYEKIMSGEPGVIITNKDIQDMFLGNNKVEVFGSDMKYYGTQFLTDRRTLLNDFLTRFGIDNIPYEKRERLTTPEVTSNAQEIAINRDYWLRTVKEALEQVNTMFGTNITVDYVKPEGVDFYDMDNGQETE